MHQLKLGKLDDKLIYKKRIRKPLNTYVRNIPPQIQAAFKAQQYYSDKNLNNPYENGGWIKYIVTTQGPMAIECTEDSTVINYEHYLEKQLSPVVDSILYFLDSSFDRIINPQQDIFE